MGGKGISTYCFPFLWDAEVGSIDCHEAVIAHVMIETALEVDLRVGAMGDEDGSEARRQQWQQQRQRTTSTAVAAAIKELIIIILKTHHHVNELGNGLNEGPYPFPVGLRVNCTLGCTDDCTPWALLWVYLHKIEGPKQMLRAPPLWAEPVTNKELPEGIYYPHARSGRAFPPSSQTGHDWAPGSGCLGQFSRSQEVDRLGQLSQRTRRRHCCRHGDVGVERYEDLCCTSDGLFFIH